MSETDLSLYTCMLTTKHRLLVPSVLTTANIDCGFINQTLHPSVYYHRTRDENASSKAFSTFQVIHSVVLYQQ